MRRFRRVRPGCRSRPWADGRKLEFADPSRPIGATRFPEAAPANRRRRVAFVSATRAFRVGNPWLTAESERSCSYITVVIAGSSRYRLNNPCATCGSFNLKTFVISPGRVPDRGGCRVAAVLGVVYRCAGSGAGELDYFTTFRGKFLLVAR